MSAYTQPAIAQAARHLVSFDVLAPGSLVYRE
jgi:hypothetical protein